MQAILNDNEHEQQAQSAPAGTGLSVEDFAALPIARYELRLRALENAVLPSFPGSTLRGAFGHALKNAVCVMRHRECSKCLVFSRCLYPSVFETRWPDELTAMRKQLDAPHPFVLDAPVYPRRRLMPAQAGDSGESAATDAITIEIPTPESVPNASTNGLAGNHTQAKWSYTRELVAGDEVIFGLALLGRTIESLPYIIYAIQEMTERGLSVRRSRFALAEVNFISPSGERRRVFDEQSPNLKADNSPPPSLSDYVRERVNELRQRWNPAEPLSLRLITPLRIKVKGDLQTGADFQLLARNLLRRVSMLGLAHGSTPLTLDYKSLLARTAMVEVRESRFRWWDWTRYSSRQQMKLQMGGFIGEISFTGPALSEFLPLLAAGEIVGVGNGTSVGLGKYVIAGYRDNDTKGVL